MKKILSTLMTSPNFTPLSTTKQAETKGGLLFVCEEKRRNFFGISYTSTQWSVVDNGTLAISVQM